MPQSKFQFPFLVPVIALAAVTACGLFPSVASAQTIFFDNFNGEKPNFGVTGSTLANWDITRGNLDVIGNSTIPSTSGGNFADLYPNNGYYLDLDGSNQGGAARLTTRLPLTLLAGDYTLSFNIGKNFDANNPLDSMVVSVGSIFSTTINDTNTPTVANVFNLKTLTFSIASNATGGITFDHAGNDDHGFIIDNVSLMRTATVGTTAPEPGSLSLLATLPVAFGMLRLRRRK